MIWTNWALILLYLLVTFWTFYNIKKYLLDQKRYKVFCVLTFYILAVIIEVIRISMCFNCIVIYGNFNLGQFLKKAYIYDVGYIVAMLLFVMLGFF